MAASEMVRGDCIWIDHEEGARFAKELEMRWKRKRGVKAKFKV